MHFETGSAEPNIFAFVNVMEVSACELSSAYCWEIPEPGSTATIKNNFKLFSANKIILLIKHTSFLLSQLLQTNEFSDF